MPRSYFKTVLLRPVVLDERVVTEEIEFYAVRAVRHGHAVVVVDTVGEGSMKDALARAAEQAGRPFHVVTPTQPGGYRPPWARLSERSIARIALPNMRLTEPHYYRIGEHHINEVVRALRAVKIEPNLHAVLRFGAPTALSRLVPEDGDREGARETKSYLGSLTERDRTTIMAHLGFTRLVCESDVGHLLGAPTPDTDSLDLVKAIQQREIVYFAVKGADCCQFSEVSSVTMMQDLLGEAHGDSELTCLDVTGAHCCQPAKVLAATVKQDLLSARTELADDATPSLVAITDCSLIDGGALGAARGSSAMEFALDQIR